jgi:ABC-type branched-subunit amino acid transport system substrate-binding protein
MGAQRRHRERTLGAIVLAVAMVVTACSSSGKASAPATTTRGTAAAGSTTNPTDTVPQPGLTATSVTVGSVATLGGPVPGLFQGAPNGASAYFAYVNSQGGVNGRQIKLESIDDQLNCSANQTGYTDNLNKVFAFVGSMSVVDNCGAKVLAANPDVSSVAFELTTESKALQNQFDPENQPTGWRLGGFEYYKQTYPNNLKVGGVYGNSSGAVLNWNAQIAAMKSIGYDVVYSRAYAPIETSFTADVLRMKSAGVNFLWVTDDDIGTIARLVNEAAQQNWHPLIFSGNTAYDPRLSTLLPGDTGNGLLNDQIIAMFQGEDRNTVPAVNTFLTWMTKTHPDFKPDLYSASGWAGAQLFVQALKAAGPNPTRASLQTALQGIHTFDADGLVAPNNPGQHIPSTCYIVMKYENQTWKRVAPATGFQCEPGGYFDYKGS